jgi:hypothetical protein
VVVSTVTFLYLICEHSKQTILLIQECMVVSCCVWLVYVMYLDTHSTFIGQHFMTNLSKVNSLAIPTLSNFAYHNTLDLFKVNTSQYQLRRIYLKCIHHNTNSFKFKVHISQHQLLQIYFK